jgi:hypothetical protein
MSNEIRELPDKRAPSMPDVPYSAYCKTCWLSVYFMWCDKVPHDGSCVHRCSDARTCPAQIGAAKNAATLAQMKRDMAAAKEMPPES